MLRALLAVGCNTYDYLTALDGAETDAKRVFDQLTDENVGNYSPAASTLLLSPTMPELKEAIERILYSIGKIDTFTYFFAGHGEIRPTGFYICLRDTRLDRLGTSAWTCDELTAAWPYDLAKPPVNNAIVCGAILASLIFPDRVPWFIFPDKNEYQNACLFSSPTST